MNNLKHLLKASTAWTSISYIVCYAGIALFPSTRENFMNYALHTKLDFTPVFTVLNFFTGLIIWNILVVLGVSLFFYLYNGIKK